MQVPSELVGKGISALELKTKVGEHYHIQEDGFYLTQNGRVCTVETFVTQEQPVHVCLRLVGGKGGFGSMLRAIGAQIEKTTNRDACRDLSGRRLRDINEEQQLKRWFSKQEEREREKEEQRKKKLEKLRQIQEGPPLPIMDDPEYNRQRSEMADSVYEAVDKGFEVAKPIKSATSTITSQEAGASSSSSSSVSDNDSSSCPASEKTTTEPQPSSSSTATTTSKSKPVKPVKKKIKKIMMDEDFSSGSSSSDESDTEPSTKKAKLT